jgi:hypothetical protein
MDRRLFLKSSTTAAGAIAVGRQLSLNAFGQVPDAEPTFKRPKVILPVPTPSLQTQHVLPGVPDSKLIREATGLLREFSTPLLFNHSHRAFFWAQQMGRQSGQKFDVELLFICAAFPDLGLIKKFSSESDRFEVDRANAVRQFPGAPGGAQYAYPNRMGCHCPTYDPRDCRIQAHRSGTSLQRCGTRLARHRI